MLKVSKFNNLELQNVPTIVGKWRLLTYEVSRSISYHLEVNFASNPPSPLEFPGPLTPPPPWNFQFPPWWGYGYFLELHIRAFVKTPYNCVYYLLYVLLFSSFFLTVMYIYDVKYRVLTIYSNYIVICVISINC